MWVAISRAIKSKADQACGLMLDIGCGDKPYEINFLPFVDTYFGLEYSPKSGYRGNRADVAGDAAALPFADETYNTILCTEVLEHVKNPENVISEIARVLKPEGIVITTAPFVFPKHDAFDYFRYTNDGLAVIMERHGLEIVEVQPLSGTGITLAMMINLYIFDIGFLWTKWLYPIGLILRPIIWLLIFLVNLTGWIIDKIIPSDHMSFNHLTVAKKTLPVAT